MAGKRSMHGVAEPVGDGSGVASPLMIPVVHTGRFTAGDYAAGKPAIWYDSIEPAAGATRPTIVMIHGGAHSGTCYLSTADGRPGWAYWFAARGHRVFVPDWPGVGRSGSIAPNGPNSAQVHACMADIVEMADEPILLFTHSMGGAIGWKLLESHGPRIRGLVAVAPAMPGNIQPMPTVLSRAADHVIVDHPSGPMKLALNEPFLAPRSWVEGKLIGRGSQFPVGHVETYLASLQPGPPTLLIERLNLDGRQLRIDDFGDFVDKPVLIVLGTHDVDHSVTNDLLIVEWLNFNGADARLLSLGDQGIDGNGHMMMMERNSDSIAGLIAEWIDSGPA